MRILVQYSGGKDSQASLLWAINKYGADKIEAVFCDTGWENPITYSHIQETLNELGIKLHTLKSKKYGGFKNLVKTKGRFPTTKRRFCTEELKVKPFIDFILDEVKDHIIVIQGIRALESASRAKMSAECRLFKYYTTPYGVNAKGKPKYHRYRIKDVKKYCKSFADDIIRPVFNWSGQEVIEYILKQGQKPNPLYSQGFSRVGCFPCIMARHNEIKQIMNRYPERIEEIKGLEQKYQSSFFVPNYIPKRCCSKSSIKNGKETKYPSTEDVINYLDDKNQTLDLFETDTQSCMSFYNLCE